MNETALFVLCLTAVSIGFIHTIIGPDHYLPFIVMSKARKWSLRRTMLLTFICGLGHVLSSVVLGMIGVVLGIALSKLEAFEAVRGGYAGKAMMIFGFTYCVWGIWHVIKNKAHTHSHAPDPSDQSITPWVLFVIFVLGPCEPLIPLLMVPAAEHSLFGTVLVATVFGVVTIGTMMSVVLVSSWGIGFVKLGRLERFTHALAGAAILFSGLAIEVLGL